MGGKNRIVVDYGDYEGLILLGAFDTKSGEEVPYEELKKLEGFELVKKHDGIKDYSVLKDMVKDNEEGFIVRFFNGDRMKVKGHEYLRLHKIMTNISTTSVWEVLSNGGNFDDMIKDVPDEFYDKIRKYSIILKYDYIAILEDARKRFNYYYENNFSPTKKEYALWVQTQPQQLQPLLYRIFDNKEYSSYIWRLIKPEFQKI